MKKRKTIAGVIIIGFPILISRAAALFVPDFSFEDFHLSDNAISTSPVWVVGGSGGGIVNPNSAQFPGAGGDQGELPAPALGPQAGFLFSAGNSAESATLTSAALGTAQPNTTYILAAAVGNSAALNDGDPQVVRLRLLLNGSVVAERVASGSDIPAGGFLDIQTSFLTGSSVSGSLQVQLVHEQPAGLGNGFRWAFYDNVRLVPEPSIAVLFCVGLFAVLLGRNALRPNKCAAANRRPAVQSNGWRTSTRPLQPKHVPDGGR